MYRARAIAVVVPAYNEADKIAATVASIPSFVDRVFVVDDASTDATAKRVQQVRRKGLCLIRHAANSGVGAAITTGYAKAFEAGCDVTAVMAGDSQMDPRDLPGLLDAVVDGRASYAKGNRFIQGGAFSEMPWVRFVGNVGLSWLTRISTGWHHLFDSQCGYTAADRRALAALLRVPLFPRYGFPNAVLLALQQAGLCACDVSVRPVYGAAWRSGIRPARVAWPILRLLAAGFVARKWRQISPVRAPKAASPVPHELPYE